MTTDDAPRMTPSDLEEALDRIRAAMPSLEEGAQRVCLAMEVIDTFLGADWLATHSTGEDPPPFLRDWRLATGDPEAFIALQRIVSLGSALYCLQDVPGFDHELRRVPSNQVRLVRALGRQPSSTARLAHDLQPRSGVED